MAELLESEKTDATTYPSLADTVYGDAAGGSPLATKLHTPDKSTSVAVKDKDSIAEHGSLLRELETNAAMLSASKLLFLTMSRKSWSSRLLLGKLWRSNADSEEEGAVEPLGGGGIRSPFPDRDLKSPASLETASGATITSGAGQWWRTTARKYCVGLPLDLLDCAVSSKTTLGTIRNKYFRFKGKPEIESGPKLEPSEEDLFSRDGIWPEIGHPHEDSYMRDGVWPEVKHPMDPRVAPTVEAAVRPVEAAAHPVEAAAPPVEAAVHPVEAVAPPAEAAMRPVEAVAPPAEAAVRPVEAAAPPVEAAAPPVEAAVRPVEAAVPPAEAAVRPVEAAVRPVEAAAPPAEAAAPPVEGTEVAKPEQLMALQRHFGNGGSHENSEKAGQAAPPVFNHDRLGTEGMKPAKDQEGVEFVPLQDGGWSRQYKTSEGLTVDETILPNGFRVFHRSDDKEEIFQLKRRRYVRVNQ